MQLYSPEVQLKAEKIRRTFSVAFTLFSKCHNVYDKCTITQEEIDSLGKYHTQSVPCFILPYCKLDVVTLRVGVLVST